MQQVLSHDGTAIAFERFGRGQPLILVVGAFNTHATALPLAEALAPHFTTFAYDRRGRGESGDTPPYAIEREVEDLDALITEAGGAASVFGYSSGALLALHAAARGLPIAKLALYDPPFFSPGMPSDHADRLASLVAAGRRGAAVEYFQSKLVGIPDEVVAQLRHAPFRPELEAIAHTLVYDATILADRALHSGLAGQVTTPTLVVAGGANPFLRDAAHALATALPGAQTFVLDGQTHDIDPSVLGPVLERFLAG